MSWVEVKKFLNKRPDKSLDEIISEQSEHDEGTLTFVTANLSSAKTALKIEGRGRVYELLAKLAISSLKAVVFEIVVDGEVFVEMTINNSNQYSIGTCEIYFTKTLFIESGRYTDFYINYTDNGVDYQWTNMNRQFLLAKSICDIDVNGSIKGYRIVIPNFVEFKNSFEIRTNMESSASTPNSSGENSALVGYKML